jgi:hypothetical protein
MKKLTFITVILFLSWSCEMGNDYHYKEFKQNVPLETKTVNLNNISGILKTSDNSFLIAGDYNSQIILIKTNTQFDSIWTKTNFSWGADTMGTWISYTHLCDIIGLFQKGNGNYLCFSVTMEGGDVMTHNTWIVEMAPGGNIVREKKIEKFATVEVIPTTDGYLLLDYTRLTKLDMDFNKVWQMVNSVKRGFEYSIISTNDGGSAETGSSNNSEIILNKRDANGNICWTNPTPYNSNPFDDAGYDLFQLPDSGFLIAGRTRNLSGKHDCDCYIVRTSFNGDSIWTKKFGTENYDWLEKNVYSSNKEYIFLGQEGNPGDEVQRKFLVKTDTSGQILDSWYSSQLELVEYDHSGYFIEAFRKDSSHIILSKVPLGELFRQQEQ